MNRAIALLFAGQTHVALPDCDEGYESLHTTLLYTDEKQDFDVVVNTFKQISGRLTEIGE